MHAQSSEPLRLFEGYTEDDFFGVTMYWSNCPFGHCLVTLSDAGLKWRRPRGVDL